MGGFGWVTALRAPAIAALAADDGPLQMSLFDQANLAEITHPDYPGERLVACRNPALATERARKRLALLEATDTELTKIVAAVAAGRLNGAGKIGVRVGKVVGRYKMAKHYILDIKDDQFAFTRDQDQITAEAALDGLYVIRTTWAPSRWTRPRSWRPTRVWPGWNETSDPSRASTWTCAPSTTGPRPGSGRTCSSACSPPTWPGTYEPRGLR